MTNVFLSNKIVIMDNRYSVNVRNSSLYRSFCQTVLLSGSFVGLGCFPWCRFWRHTTCEFQNTNRVTQENNIPCKKVSKLETSRSLIWNADKKKARIFLLVSDNLTNPTMKRYYEAWIQSCILASGNTIYLWITEIC